MRKHALMVFSLLLLVGCGISPSEHDRMVSDYDAIRLECDSIKKINTELIAKLHNDTNLIKTLRDSVLMLSFPAGQRLDKITSLINENDFDSARNEIESLVKLFPDTKEAKECPRLLTKIDELEQKKIQEDERRKAMGFKGIKAVSSCKIDYNKVEISGISIGNTFTFDSYGDWYFYRTADRGNKYISAVLKITSDSKDPRLPQPAVYSIVGDKMILVDRFTVEFARWKDYGSYLGNYHDNGNDFAKTSTIRFKIGVEVSEDDLKKPYAIVLKNENSLQRQYNRFDNPPVSYGGQVDYPNQLILEDFLNESSDYYLLKIANL